MTSYVVIALVVLLFAWIILSNRQREPGVSELQHWFSARLAKISEGLEHDIEQDKAGHYPHRDRESFEPRGSITYVLVDKNHERFEISQFHELGVEAIRATQGYDLLRQKTESLGLKLELDEREVEGDGVDSWFELDEYVPDIPRFYTVTVSGWNK